MAAAVRAAAQRVAVGGMWFWHVLNIGLHAVLKGEATSCRGRLAEVSGPFGWPSKMIMAYALLWAHGVLACGCVASVPARNDRLKRAWSPHLPPTSEQALCSMAGVYKFIMPSWGIRNRVRVSGFFHESV